MSHTPLDLNFDLRGRRGSVPPILDSRALSVDEVAERASREAGIKPSALQRITGRHKLLARLLVEGKSTTEAAAAVGLSVSRVSILKQDATFQDLLRTEEALHEDANKDFREAVAALGVDATHLLHDKMEEDPDAIDPETLVRLIQMTADRSGLAPKRTEEHNVTFNFGERLDAARKRVREAMNEKVIEHTPTEAAE